MAGEPWTDAQNTIVEAGGFLRLLPGDTSTGNDKEIYQFGTKTDFLKTSSEKEVYSNPVGLESEYKYKKLSTGVTLRVEKTAPVIDAVTGSAVSNQADSADKYHIGVLAGKTETDQLISWIRSSKPVFACISLGINAVGQNVGFAHILGKISGDIQENRKDEFSIIDITIKGGSGFTIKETTPGTPDLDESDYNSTQTGASNKIEPVGKSEVTLKDLAAQDWTDLLTGKIVRTADS